MEDVYSNNSFEYQYLGIMDNILKTGQREANRTGIDTLATWGQTIKADLSKGFPIITTRKTSLRIAFEETWFFLRGETDTKKLEAKKIGIWTGNTSREFLDKVGLNYLPEGHMGKGYSFQWRNFGGEYKTITEYPEYKDLSKLSLAEWEELNKPSFDNRIFQYDKSEGGVDQIANLLEGMKKDPTGRRHIVTAWNPQQTTEMALPPCHLYHQYRVTSDGKLNSTFVMRSWDFLYGAPFNIMGYALLNHAFAKYLKLEPGVLVGFGNDVHLYDNQLDIARQQIERTPFNLPKLTITKELNSLEDILSLEYSDIVLEGYEAHPDFKDKPKMAV
jgi:thymidylate synthase